MARRRPDRSRVRPSSKRTGNPSHASTASGLHFGGRRAVILIALGAVGLLLALAVVARPWMRSPARLRSQAEAEAQSGNWAAALKAWRAYNATTSARADSHREEARACLALGLAAQAETALRRAIADNPSDPEPWRLLLEIFRVEDRTLDAQQVGWDAYRSVPIPERPAILEQLTLALLADIPDDVARSTLTRWTKADPDDVNARVALEQRIATQPRAGDPDRDTRLAQLQAILDAHPEHIAAREALIASLLDGGEPDRAYDLLQSWPDPPRDARYWRLQGRYLLDHAKQPEAAVRALENALTALPRDWRSWYRLARALRTAGRSDGQDRTAAQAVARIRETLDPLALAPRLSADFSHLDQSAALLDLAALCGQVGLSKLAAAWRAQVPPAPSSNNAVQRNQPIP
jgi:tetratricopeptide (TPR) repeat protein